MIRRRTAIRGLFWAAVPLFVGCSVPFHHGSTQNQEVQGRDGVFRERGAVVLTGSALTDGEGSLLSTMKGKIPGFQVQTGPDICPEISLRGQASFSGFINPDVYVDGTRATDTCILETLSAKDAERVEIYPMGFTMRPGYRTHAEGLILVFLRS